ncbi:MAG: D-glycero-beta-D-manno-heptose 1-phosphate adenylyltransferase [Anaerolineae bacterium]
MKLDLPEIVARFPGLRVLVIGDAILDSYSDGVADRLCREAPVPVVTVDSRVDAPGGAANTAANLCRLGAEVDFLSVVGSDYEAALLRQALAAEGVATEHVLSHPARRTLAKHRVLSQGHLLVRFDQGSTGPVDRRTEGTIIERLTVMFHASDAVIVSDYGYGILSPRVIGVLAHLQRQSPRVLVADAKHLPAYRTVGVTAVKPNYQEALRLLGESSRGAARDRADQILGAKQRIFDLTGAQIAAVTLDTEGAVILERGAPPYRTYAQPASHSRAAGAGDTYLSALALALAAGGSTSAAAELAAAAAAVVVGRDGTTVCTADELLAAVSTDFKPTDVAHLTPLLETYRQQGRRIVFTNGCFDILHSGHISYLSQAKALGDVLVVGVNTDDGVRRLKGPTRPVNSVGDRMKVLAALSCVDHIVAFDEDTPIELIRAIRPHVFVKGGDYTRERLPEADVVEQLGGVIQILPYVRERSTTRMIERIQAHGELASHAA